MADSILDLLRNKVMTKTPEISVAFLKGEEFRTKVGEKIAKAEWAPDLSTCLTDLTLAQLQERSTINENLALYMQLAHKANDVAANEGNAPAMNPVRMLASINVAIEAARRVNDAGTKI
jgi:hypothetical protein